MEPEIVVQRPLIDHQSTATALATEWPRRRWRTCTERRAQGTPQIASRGEPAKEDGTLAGLGQEAAGARVEAEEYEG